jgi:hypothetical protein
MHCFTVLVVDFYISNDEWFQDLKMFLLYFLTSQKSICYLFWKIIFIFLVGKCASHHRFKWRNADQQAQSGKKKKEQFLISREF